jgi:hypothetical protein
VGLPARSNERALLGRKRPLQEPAPPALQIALALQRILKGARHSHLLIFGSSLPTSQQSDRSEELTKKLD